MCAFTHTDFLDQAVEGNSKHTTLAFTHFFLTSGQEERPHSN